MSDRLNELRRQRALAQEQLAWFDREIAREEKQPAPVVAKKSAKPAVPAPALTPAADEVHAEQIIEQYRDQGRSIQSDVRRGCFLYFGAAFALLGLALLLFYLFRRG